MSIVVLLGVALGLWMGLLERPASRDTMDAETFVELFADIMATRIAVQVHERDAQPAGEIVFGVFREVDARMSEWKDTSPLSAVNQAAGDHAVPVPDDLRAVITRGLELGHLTDGAFDITWAALWGLWDFKAESPSVPDPAEIARRIALVDSSRVVVNDAEGTVFLPQRGMVLGLGGIAKGYALDRAGQALRDAGIRDFLISGGGQILAGGSRGGRPWRVGIRDPRADPPEHFAWLELTDTSVSTSGDYERYFIIHGKRYHHILDPRTGYPAQGLRSVTVVCPDATLADALSTAMMVLGPERARALADSLDSVEAVFVDTHGVFTCTDGLLARLTEVRAPLGSE